MANYTGDTVLILFCSLYFVLHNKEHFEIFFFIYVQFHFKKIYTHLNFSNFCFINRKQFVFLCYRENQSVSILFYHPLCFCFPVSFLRLNFVFDTSVFILLHFISSDTSLGLCNDQHETH